MANPTLQSNERTMTTIPAAKQQTAEIRQRMQAIRCDLPTGMEEAREDVSNLTDWKYYVRSYPEIMLPVVAAAAYSLVPQARKPAASQVAFLDGDKGIRRVQLVEESVPKKSIISGVVSSLLTLALRSGSTIAARQLSQMLHGPRNPE